MIRLSCCRVLVCVVALSVMFPTFVNAKERKDKTAFQTSQPWKPTTDNRADVAIIYGVGGNPGERRANKTFEERVQSWRDRGYLTYFMTGIAWGEYVDYFTGGYDGKWHLDEGQVTQRGDTIWHGRMIPYIVPSMNFIKYMKDRHIKRVVDAGIDAIFLEEPEFWAHGGYSEAFKREWKDYYGFDWRPQHESAENTYLSNKLKYHLYYRALNETFTYAKQYGKTKGMDVKCYVPTHSLLNYSQWQIVSPEASLASLPCVDGYIAQVWTNTSREPNYFKGNVRERVFETAFLEYGCMQSMVAPTKRKVWLLTDPVEDSHKDWVDYKRCYQATFTAKLLYPETNSYEVMPWPDRIYEGLYSKSAGSKERIRIPRFYSTQMQVMINSLNSMPLSKNRVSGTHGIAVLMANSLMFQRSQQPVEGYEDPQLSNFYGMAMPLVKRGVPAQIMHIENTGYADNWRDVKLLVATYSNMKPLDAAAHRHIANWVKRGGVLLYCGRDDDPFQKVQEWWNTGGNNYATPADHLFEAMGIKAGAEAGTYAYGKGTVCIMRRNPKEFAMTATGDAEYYAMVEALYENATGKKPQQKNYFTLSRGCYDLISVVDEGVSAENYVAEGRFIDLFNHELPVLSKVVVKPGEQSFLLNIDAVKNQNKPQVLAAAARVYDEKVKNGTYTFVVKSPIETTNAMRVLLPRKPNRVELDGKAVEVCWDELSKTVFLTHENSPEGVNVVIKY